MAKKKKDKENDLNDLDAFILHYTRIYRAAYSLMATKDYAEMLKTFDEILPILEKRKAEVGHAPRLSILIMLVYEGKGEVYGNMGEGELSLQNYVAGKVARRAMWEEDPTINWI